MSQSSGSNHDLSANRRALLRALLEESGAPAPNRPIPRRKETGPAPLSFAQERIWFLEQLQPGTPLHNIPSAFRLPGPLHTGVLERSLQEIVRRHEILRSTFEMRNGQPVQLVHPRLSVTIPLIDLEARPVGTREKEALRLYAEAAQQPMDLRRGPLLRAGLVRLSGQDHILILVLHHIVADGWSMGVLYRELGALYQASVGGSPKPLPELPIQYADYAGWQRQWVRDQVLEQQWSYWQERLRNAPALLELPSDRPRPESPTLRGGVHAFQLPSELSAAIRGLSRRRGATLFMTLLAAFQSLLYRYTGQPDVVVGTPVANRNRTEVEGLIGCFVNMLVLRTDLGGNPSFGEVLERARQCALGALANQELPFELLVEKLQPDRSLSHNPLFQVLFVFQSEASAPSGRQPENAGSQTPDSHQSTPNIGNGTAKFDLTLSVSDDGRQISGAVEYAIDLFDDSTIARLADHFQRLLESGVADPDKPVSDLEILSGPERRRLLEEWNPALPAASTECLHRIFEAVAAESPDRAALEFGSESRTFSQLNRRANGLARLLRQRGIGPERVVGLALPRSIDLLVSILAVLKAGGAYLLLEPTDPAERLDRLVDTARASLVLTREEWVGHFSPPHPALPLDLEEVPELDTPPAGLADPDALAAVTIVSLPSGCAAVERCHRALRQAALPDNFELSRHDRVGQLSPVASPCFEFEFWSALVRGACLVASGADPSLSPLEVASWIMESRISAAILSSAAFQDLATEAPWCFSSLRLLLLHGGQPGATAVQKVLASDPPRRLSALYGAIECGAVSSARDIEESPRMGEVASLGRPVAGKRFYVLDARLQPVPIGVEGDLYLGNGLARGWSGRPWETALRFIPDPYGLEPGGRLFATGDRASFLPDGSVKWRGRRDRRVQVRGFRVDPGEVELVLGGHPDLAEVAVVPRRDPSGNLRLIAYVAGSAVVCPSASQLRSFLRKKLPDRMIPSVFLTVDALPRDAAGVLNEGALPAPETERPDLGVDFLAPRTPTESALAEIWTRVFGLERLGVEDNFFHLGGHSLLMTQVTSRARDALGVDVPLRRFFMTPTIAGLAAYIEEQGGGRAASGLPPLLPAPRDQELPLSYAQERIWFLDQLDPGLPAYNIPVALSWPGPIDESALERALNAIVARHETLRTSFQTRDSRPVQVIAESARVDLQRIDLSRHAGGDQWEEALRVMNREARRTFDLSRGPLLRVALLRLGEQNHVLLLTIHHVISDVWSIGILLEELSQLYQPNPGAPPPNLPELPVQYADYAVWQRRLLQGEKLEKELSFWRRRLEGAQFNLELPTDFPRPPVQSALGATSWFGLSPSIYTALTELCRREQVTLFVALLAAFKVLLHRYTGECDILVGSPVANRGMTEIEPLIGFFINTLVLRTDLSGNPSFRELLHREREVLLEAQAHQTLPFEKLVEELQPKRNLDRNPLFQVMFVFQNNPRLPSPAESQPQSSAPAPIQVGTGTSKFDLTLAVMEGGGRLSCGLEYSRALFAEGTIRRMAEHYRNLLQEALANPERRLGELSPLSEGERRRQIEEWNRTGGPKPEGTLLEGFEERARRDPESTALVCGKERIGAGELARRAHRLARYLRRRGVGPETRVGVCLEREVELVVALLGVLAAGGAYVPLDPSYPAERLRLMVSDSGARLVLTRRGLSAGLELEGVELVPLEEEREAIARESDRRPESGVAPENLAYLIYTSGSTGRPKGVAIEHRSARAMVQWALEAYPERQLRGVLASTSVCFDLSVFELFVPLSGTGRVALAPDALAVEAQLWAEVSLLNTVPSAAAALLELGGIPETVEVVNLAGEALRGELARRLLEGAAGRSVYNLYGPTEDTTYSTWWRVDRSEPGDPPIGTPIAGGRAYVLDRYLQPAPAGVAGELYVAGAGLARGYWGRPGPTAEAFLPDPWAREPGRRMYRTGDRARHRADGALEYLGRVDHQVKVRGFRIEPGEVEAALAGHPAVAGAAVVAPGRGGDQRLVAYLSAAPGERPREGELRRYLEGRLPQHMVPARFVQLDRLPLTPNGKVDRRELLARPLATQPDGGDGRQPPEGPVERLLAGIWGEVLSLDRVGRGQNFFELGGHSLLATQVASRIREACGVVLPLRTLFQLRTVAELATEVTRLQSSGTATADSGIPRLPRQRYRDGLQAEPAKQGEPLE